MSTAPLLDTWRQLLAAGPSTAEARLKVFRDAARDIGRHVGDGLTKPDAVDELLDMAAVYDFFDVGDAAIERIIGEEFLSAGDSEADREADREMVQRLEEYDRKRERERGQGNGQAAAGDSAAAPSEPPPLPWLDMSSWDDGPPPPIEWSITNLVPREQVGLFSGVGGTGKTTCELLKDVAHVTGLPWFNWMPTQGPVLFVGCEDTDKVWRIRLTVIAKHFNTTFADLIKGGFHLLNLYRPGRDVVSSLRQERPGRDDAALSANLSSRWRSEADQHFARSAGAHLCGQRDGSDAGLWPRRPCQALALASGGSVTLLTHPSLQGIRSGSGYSGSTAWHDAFRFRQYLRAAQEDEDEPVDPANDNGLRELTFMKNQYGRPPPS